MPEGPGVTEAARLLGTGRPRRCPDSLGRLGAKSVGGFPSDQRGIFDPTSVGLRSMTILRLGRLVRP